MDITIDTEENKIIVHLERFDKRKSFAVMVNRNGLTVKMTVDELVNALKVVANSEKKEDE